MYKVEGIIQAIWKYSKSNFKYETYEELLDDLRMYCSEWLQEKCHFSETELVNIVSDAYIDYASKGIPAHLSRYMFKHIIGDYVMNMVYGEDDRCLNQRVIEGVLIALRNTQIYDNKEKLIDFGQ